MEPFFTDDQLHQVLRQSVGINVEVIRQKVVNRGHQYLVLLVWLQHPKKRVVIKLAGPGSVMASSFERTAMLHRLISEHTSVPVAEIAAFNMSLTDWPWRYLVQVYIPGMQWAHLRGHLDEPALSRAYHQIGNAVAQLHTLQFPAFGEISADGGVLNPQAFLAALVDRAKNSIKNQRLCESFLFVLDSHQARFQEVRQACLCHEDLHGYNLLFHRRKGQWHLASILDFDKAWAGHSEIDLARMQFWRGMNSPELLAAYADLHPVDPAYLERRPIYQLLWCFEYARSTPEHLADTQQLCRQYGFPIPDRFSE